MATSDKTYAVMVDANNKLLFPTAETFIEANTELGGGNLPDSIVVSDNGDITINKELTVNSAFSVNSDVVNISGTASDNEDTHIAIDGGILNIRGNYIDISSINGSDDSYIDIYSNTDITLEARDMSNEYNSYGINCKAIIKTNGIHEQNVYTNEPSYSMKGWYLASKIENPYFLLGGITFDDLKNDPYANRFFVLLSDTKIPYETAKDISSMDNANVDMSSHILQNLAVGDILTIKNNWNLINAARVSAIEGNRIEIAYIFDNLNDSYMPYMFDLQQYGDHILNASVRCFAKPDAGYVEFAGANATAVGGSSNISRGYLSTNVGGRRNNTCGDFSVSIGEDNIVEGKSSVALGSQNIIKQENNISIGNINEMTANVRQGFIFGGNNKTYQENSVLVGRGLTLNRQNNSLTRTIVGRFNNPAEDGAVVIGTGQGPTDLYNGAIIDRTSCTFRGKQTFEYYNSGDAFTSKHGIVSLGSNDVADTAKSGTYMLGGGLTRDQYSNTSNTGTRTIVGVFNEDISGNPAFVVGAGANNDNRKNIIEAYSDRVNVNGKLITKDLQCGGTSIDLGSNNTVTSGTYALGAGLKQTTSIGSQVITGVFNKENVKDSTYGVPVFTIGNGWADNNRSNAIEVYRNLTKINNNVELNNVKSNNDINIASDSNINLKYGNSTVINITDELTLTSSTISVNGYTTFNDGIFTSSIDGSENSILSLYNNGAGDTQTHLTYDNISLVIGRHDAGADFDFNIDGSFTGYKHLRAGSDPDTSTGFNLSVSNGLRLNSYNESAGITNSATYSANGIGLTDDSAIYELNIFKSGIRYSLTAEGQSTGEITLDNTGINVKPSPDYQSSKLIGGISITGDMLKLNGVPEEFEGANRVEITNKAIKFYDCYENEGLEITDYRIDFKNVFNSRITNLTNITIKQTSNGPTIEIDGDKINLYTGLTIGHAYSSGVDNNIQLVQAFVGEANIGGMLTTKLLRDFDDTPVGINSGEYTDCLLNKLSREYVGPDPDTEEPVFREHDFSGFDETAVGLDYFYNVIKELNARIKELESVVSSTDPVDQIKLRIDGTDEYCIVKAKKDENGAITLTWK